MVDSEGGFPKYQLQNLTMPRCAAHKRRRAGRIRFRARRNRIGLHVAKPPQRTNLSSIARRVKSCPVQTHLSCTECTENRS
jgi:hypothetical protein